VWSTASQRHPQEPLVLAGFLDALHELQDRVFALLVAFDAVCDVDGCLFGGRLDRVVSDIRRHRVEHINV